MIIGIALQDLQLPCRTYLTFNLPLPPSRQPRPPLSTPFSPRSCTCRTHHFTHATFLNILCDQHTGKLLVHISTWLQPSSGLCCRYSLVRKLSWSSPFAQHVYLGVKSPSRTKQRPVPSAQAWAIGSFLRSPSMASGNGLGPATPQNIQQPRMIATESAASPPSKRDLASWWKTFKKNTKKEEERGR